jgi:uncharacterized protein (TIGR03083 family)
MAESTTDDSAIKGLDPFDRMDDEAARIATHYAALPRERWHEPTRCAGWSVRDVLAHLLASEQYNRACLDGTVADLMASFATKGITSLDDFNQRGVDDLAGTPDDDLLQQWMTAYETTRNEFRARGDGVVDTSIGDYPTRWQAFHLANELAIHADDVGVPVTDIEREARLAWRVACSRFVLGETKPDAVIAPGDGRTHVRSADGAVDVDLDDTELVDAVAGRLDDSSRLDAATRSYLSAT